MDDDLRALITALSDDDTATADIPDLPVAFSGPMPAAAVRVSGQEVPGHSHATHITYHLLPDAPANPQPGDVWIRSGAHLNPPVHVEPGVLIWDATAWLPLTKPDPPEFELPHGKAEFDQLVWWLGAWRPAPAIPYTTAGSTVLTSQTFSIFTLLTPGFATQPAVTLLNGDHNVFPGTTYSVVKESSSATATVFVARQHDGTYYSSGNNIRVNWTATGLSESGWWWANVVATMAVESGSVDQATADAALERLWNRFDI